MKFSPFVLASFMLLGACSATQLTAAENAAQGALSAVVAACAGAQTAEATAKQVAPTSAKVAGVATYVDATCSDANTIVAVAANPTTTAWLNGLNADLVQATAPAAAPVATTP